MSTRFTRRRVLALAAAGGIAAGLLGSRGSALAAPAQTYTIANVGAYGGEPSIASDGNGVLYDSTPSGGLLVYRSTDHGASWTAATTPDPASGDSCLATDQSNAVYACNLAGSQGKAPLQADVWKSTNQGSTWAHGQGAVADQCGTSCSPFGVDRQWTAASIPTGGTAATAEVVLMYHDFYGPSQIWVNISHDGGATFGAPQEVLASPAVTPGAVTGTLTAEGYTFCNTVPTGVGIVKPGLVHAGRMYVSWVASDLPSDALGCNISQAESFHTLWVSYSDDNGVTWTPQQAFDAGVGHDASTPFAAFTLDDQGNPYIAFAANHWDPSPTTNLANTARCAAESTAGTVQTDFACEYDMYVVWSQDGGATWDGGGGTILGSAAAPYQVNPVGETGTHWFPAIAVSDPGQVDVAYLHTGEILPTDPAGKADPGGCAGPIKGNPPTFPPACHWDLYAGQSLNLTSSPATATWTTADLTGPMPMHIGDICNLGIACGPTSNRNLLDFIQEAVDPTTGCAHIAYADDNTVNLLRVANQTAGCLTIPGANIAETPWAALFVPAGAVAALAARRIRRRGQPANFA